MWNQYIILSAGRELKNIRKQGDKITFWGLAVLFYLFIFYSSGWSLTTSLSKCNPEIQSAGRWGITTPSAVSAASTAVAIYCRSVGCEDLQRYTFHPWSGGKRKRRRRDCLCLWFQNAAKSSSLTSTWKLCHHLRDWFHNCGVETRRRRWGEVGVRERNPGLSGLNRLDWLSPLQLIPQLLFGFVTKEFMFSAMSACLFVGRLVGMSAGLHTKTPERFFTRLEWRMRHGQNKTLWQ